MPLWSAGESLLSSRVVLEVHVGVALLVAPRGAGLVVLVRCAVSEALDGAVVCLFRGSGRCLGRVWHGRPATAPLRFRSEIGQLHD